MPIGFHDRVYSILRRLRRLESQPALFLGTNEEDQFVAFVAVPETKEILHEGSGISIEDALDHLFGVILKEGEFVGDDLKLLNKRICMFWVGSQATGRIQPILRKFTTGNFIRIAPDEGFTPPHFYRKTAMFAFVDKASQKAAINFYSRF